MFVKRISIEDKLKYKIDKLQDMLNDKNNAVFQLDSIRFKALTGDEYNVIRGSLEDMSEYIEREQDKCVAKLKEIQCTKRNKSTKKLGKERDK